MILLITVQEMNKTGKMNESHTVMSYFFPLISVLFIAEIRRISLHLSG